MGSDQRNAKWFVIVVHVEVAALLLFFGAFGITRFLIWLTGDVAGAVFVPLELG